jgi:tetratricopeptide (TPR) repeat protein
LPDAFGGWSRRRSFDILIHDDIWNGSMSNKIFVNYRRADAAADARSIFQRLAQTIGRDQLFIDIDSIEKGSHFPSVLDRVLNQCRVMLVIIGRDWIDAKNEKGARRLSDPNDYVRLEIATALRREIPIIPVRIDGAPLPASKELPPDIGKMCSYQARIVTHENFSSDMVALQHDIERWLHGSRSRSRSRGRSSTKSAPAPEEPIHIAPNTLDARAKRDVSDSAKEMAHVPEFSQSNRAEALVQHKAQARFNAASGKLDQAIYDCSVVMELDLANIELLEIRAACYQKKGDYSNALKDYDRLFSIGDGGVNLQWLKDRATCHHALGDLYSAVSDYTTFIESSPKDPFGYQHRAECLRQIGNQPKVVIGDYSALIKLQPKATQWRQLRAEINKELEDYGAARKDYQSLIDMEYSNANWHVLLAGCEVLDHWPSHATRTYQQLIELEPKVTKWYELFVQHLISQKDRDEAMRVASKLIELQPDETRWYELYMECQGGTTSSWSDEIFDVVEELIKRQTDEIKWYELRAEANKWGRRDVETVLRDYTKLMKLARTSGERDRYRKERDHYIGDLGWLWRQKNKYFLQSIGAR